MTIRRRTLFELTGLALAAPAILRHPARASAPDKVRVGVFPVSSSLPFFVAQTRGYFAEMGIEPVPTRMASSTLILGGFLNDDLDTAAAVVMLEALNINIKAPGTVAYVSINGQNAEHLQESIVVRNGIEAKSIAGLKGKASKFMAASGPANTLIAKAVFKANGLEDGRDYQLTDLALNLHVGAMTAGTFDAGYTLEPGGTILATGNAAQVIEKGVVSTYMLGNPKALTFGAGGAMNGAFIKAKPDVATRYAAAWKKAITTILTDETARDDLKGNTAIPPALVRQVGIPLMKMAADATQEDRLYLQKFVDFATEQKIVTAKVDTAAALQVF
ncbi:MAG: ABC transporter substrate-binding protein [Acetobacteraceae bacterium]